MTNPRTRLYVPLAIAALLACSKGEQAGTTDTAAAGAATAATTAAAAPRGGPITEAEIRNYRLTMDKVREMHRLQLQWIKDTKGRRLESDDSDEAGDVTKDATTTEGANEMLRLIERDPAAAAAIRRVGVEPRDAAIHSMVLAMSSIFAAAPGGELPPDIAPENVAFAKANMAELQRLQQEQDSVTSAARGQS